MHNTLETLPSTIPNIVEYMGRWGANALVPSAQFTKDEMWSQAAKVGPRCPNSSCGAPLPWWPACPTLSFQTHRSLCLGVGGAGGWQGWGGRVSHWCQSPDHTTAMPHCCFYLSCLVPWLLSPLLLDANSLLLSQGISAPLQGCPIWSHGLTGSAP